MYAGTRIKEIITFTREKELEVENIKSPRHCQRTSRIGSDYGIRLFAPNISSCRSRDNAEAG
jgi:hypothetical protein